MTRRALIVMAKRPFPGHTKTRLCPPLTMTQAADFYEHCLRDVLQIVRHVPGVTPFVAVAPATASAYFRQLAPDFQQVLQQGDSLGARLDFVLSSLLAAGYEQVAAINSDSPTLPPAYLAQAFAELDSSQTDVVFGPTEDGGYYLIGWKRPLSFLVRNVQMSTPQVLQESLRLAAAAHLQAARLPTWYDIDDGDDLQRVLADAHSLPHRLHIEAFATTHLTP